MAPRKKRTRRQKPGKPKALKLPPEAILQRAEAELDAGHPRRAREGFRRLFKQDPERYREAYFEVIGLLIDECLAQKQFGEVRVLLDQLKELGVEESQIANRRMLLAISTQDQEAMAGFSEELLDGCDPAQQITLADALVLAGDPSAAVILSAISHLCRGEWEAMRTVLKAVGRKSAFAHWRLFLRGCAGYYNGKQDEERACFGRLPLGSVPHRKAAAFGPLQGLWQDSSDEVMRDACLLAGEPALAKCLPSAQQHWMRGKYLSAYKMIRRGVDDFPSIKVDASGQLTRFFQLVDTDMHPQEHEIWVESVFRGGIINSLRENVESYMVANILARCQYGNSDQTLIRNSWERYLQIRSTLRGKNARFSAYTYLEMADAEDPEIRGSGGFFSNPSFKHYALVIQYLEESGKADPSFEEPYLRLLKLYRNHGRHKECNRLLDEMTKKFPESKTVLLQAGQACLDRKSPVKGLAYLERARALDPLDAEIQAQIRRGMRERAIAAFKKGSAVQRTKGRAIIGELLDSLPHHPPLGESRNYVLIWWSTLEDVFSPENDSLAQEKFTEGSRELPAHVAEFYRLVQFGIVFSSSGSGGWVKGCQPKARGAKTLEQALLIYQLWNDVSVEDKRKALINMDAWIYRYIDASLRKLRRSDLPLARTFIGELRKHEHHWHDHGDHIIRKCLALDRSNPYFVSLSWYGLFNFHFPSPEEIKETREEAQRCNDQEALALIARYEQEELARGDPSDLPDFLDEPDDFDEPDRFDIGDSGGDAMPTPEEVVEQIRAEIWKIPRKDRIKFLLDRGIPKEEAKALLLMLETVGENPGKSGADPLPMLGKRKNTKKKIPKKKVAKKKPKASPQEPDPDQFDLPF